MTAPINIQSYTQGSGTSGNNNVAVPIFSNRDPTAQDMNYLLGTRWINQADNSEFVLTSFSVSSGVRYATWARLGNASGNLDSLTVDGADIILPTAGTITITGYPVNSGGLKTIVTYDGGSSSVEINDLTNLTPYVVGIDANKGLFTSIQSAVDQAVSDGANSTNPAVVYLQAGTYTEDVNLSPYVHLSGMIPNVSQEVVLQGRITCDITGISSIQNMTIATNALNPSISITGSGDSNLLLFNVNVFGYGQTALYINNASSEVLVANSSFSVEDSGKVFNIVSNSILIAKNSITNSTNTESSLQNCTLQFKNCDINDSFSLTSSEVSILQCNTNANSIGFNCSIDSGSLVLIEGGTINSNPTFTGSGLLIFGQISVSGSGYTYSVSSTLDILAASVFIGAYPFKTIGFSDSPYSILGIDQYVGCNTSTGAISAVLPGINYTNAGSVFTIKDVDGSASVNNITISVAGGLTIDGSLTRVINTNYGVLNVLFNGGTYSIV